MITDTLPGYLRVRSEFEEKCNSVDNNDDDNLMTYGFIAADQTRRTMVSRLQLCNFASKT